MRVSCISLFLAVGARPVGVFAHVEPLDIAATDGQIEVQRHLRVQELTLDEDAEDRMAGFDMIEKVAEKLGQSSAGIVKHPLDISKLRQLVSDFLVKAADLQISNEEALKFYQDSVSQFETVLSTIDKDDLPFILKQANNLFAEGKTSPIDVFKLYGLNFAGNELLKQPQMEYWMKYLDILYAESGTSDWNLVHILLQFYDKPKLAAAIENAANIFAFRLKLAIEKYYKTKP